jgi:Domain of unknown function (DUF4249)
MKRSYISHLALGILGLTALSSCEKIIDLDLDKSQNKIVIQGNITNQPGPYLISINQSINIKEEGQASPIAKANVVLSDDNGFSETLKDLGNGQYETTNTKGSPGRTYTLKVTCQGQEYKASSTMPEVVPLDRLLYREIPFRDGSNHTVTPKFTDPQALGNNYRFVLKINGKIDKRYVVDNDQINNGKAYDRPLFNEDIKPGDLVEVEMRCTDYPTYMYYYTIGQIESDGPGGGISPSNPPNNWSNGALGLFSAYNTQKKEIRIPTQP